MNGLNCVICVKAEERYIFLFDDQHAANALRCAGKWAANPEMAFNWRDAADICKRIREIANHAKEKETA